MARGERAPRLGADARLARRVCGARAGALPSDRGALAAGPRAARAHQVTDISQGERYTYNTLWLASCRATVAAKVNQTYTSQGAHTGRYPTCLAERDKESDISLSNIRKRNNHHHHQPIAIFSAGQRPRKSNALETLILLAATNHHAEIIVPSTCKTSSLYDFQLRVFIQEHSFSHSLQHY